MLIQDINALVLHCTWGQRLGAESLNAVGLYSAAATVDLLEVMQRVRSLTEVLLSLLTRIGFFVSVILAFWFNTKLKQQHPNLKNFRWGYFLALMAITLGLVSGIEAPYIIWKAITTDLSEKGLSISEIPLTVGGSIFVSICLSLLIASCGVILGFFVIRTRNRWAIAGSVTWLTIGSLFSLLEGHSSDAEGQVGLKLIFITLSFLATVEYLRRRRKEFGNEEKEKAINSQTPIVGS